MTESLLKYFRLLYDQIPFPVQVINESGKIVFVNHAFTFQWGYNLSELNSYSIFNDSELKKSGAHQAILETFDKGEFRFINNYADSLLISKEKTFPVYRTKLFPISIENKTYVVLFHEDQTEIVLAEAEVKKARDGNKEAERLKDTFLTVLSHELRTPLNIVLGYSSIIRESMRDKLSSEDRIYLDNLYSGSERLYNSITQMLEFAQIEAGNYVMNIETVDLNSVILNCLDANKDSAFEKKLDLRTNFKDKNIFVDVDIQSLENAINNLLKNAVKFTKRGFVEIETNILEERELAVCRIKDSGVGISTEYFDHLFQPFSQEDLNIGRNFEGNGLGLALAKRYIEKLGGSLLADSIKGVGSTFTFTLPISQNIEVLKKKYGDGKEKKNNRILMIDFRNESYDLLNAFLKNNYTIILYDQNDFKLDALENSDYEVIIIDVNQNNWDQCLDLCKQIKTHDQFNRPILIISTEYQEEKINTFLQAGAAKFIVKPFTKNDLLKTLTETKNKTI